MTSLTRVERILSDAGFGTAVITGLSSDRLARASVRTARQVWRDKRQEVGYADATPVLTPGVAQSKLAKNSLYTLGLMLMPERGLMSEDFAGVRSVFRLVGPVNVCPLASEGCTMACLSRSGQSGMRHAQFAQAVRTAFLLAFPRECGLIIGAEIRNALQRHGRINLRLNVTSDIRWEVFAPEMVQALADAGVELYDYTAWSPSNRVPSREYHLTYSAKEVSHTSDEYIEGILRSGGNVAMPFGTKRGMPLPESWHGFKVIDGDLSDERRNDPKGVVVGLRAKGHEWKRDNTSGFIRPSVVI